MDKAKAIETLKAYITEGRKIGTGTMADTKARSDEAQDALDRLTESPEADTRPDDHYQANRRRKINEMGDHFRLARDILTELQGHNMSTDEQQKLSDCKGLLARIWNITYFFTSSDGRDLLHE